MKVNTEGFTYVIGDPHLKEIFKGSELFFETDGSKVSVLLKAFDILVDRLISLGTSKDSLVILGDIFDRPNVTPGFMQKVTKRITRLSNHFDRIDILSGNHDESEYSKYSAIDSLSLLTNVFVYSKYSGYEPPFYPYDKDLKEIINLGFPVNYSHNYHHPVFSDEFVKVGYDVSLVLAGHYHDAKKVGSNIVYIGSPYPINKSELHNNRILKVKPDGKFTEVSTNDILNWVTLDAGSARFSEELKVLSLKFNLLMVEVYNVESDAMLESDLKAYKGKVFCYKASKKGLDTEIDIVDDSREILYDLSSLIDQAIEDGKVIPSIKQEVVGRLKQMLL